MHSVKGGGRGRRGWERENGRETKAVGESARQGTNKDVTARGTGGGSSDREKQALSTGKFSTRKKSESRPALVSIAGCAVSLTFPLFVKRSAGRVLFAFK